MADLTLHEEVQTKIALANHIVRLEQREGEASADAHRTAWSAYRTLFGHDPDPALLRACRVSLT